MKRKAFYSFALICTGILFHSCHGPEYKMFGYADDVFIENNTTNSLHMLFGK